MPAPRLKQPYEAPDIGPVAPSAPTASARGSTAVEPGAESARVLQQRLAEAIEHDGAPETGSWPGALKVLVLVGSSALLWGAILAAGRLLLG